MRDPYARRPIEIDGEENVTLENTQRENRVKIWNKDRHTLALTTFGMAHSTIRGADMAGRGSKRGVGRARE